MRKCWKSSQHIGVCEGVCVGEHRANTTARPPVCTARRRSARGVPVLADKWRRIGAATVAVCALCGLAAGAQAQQSTTTNPAEELWRSYPLEQKATTTQAAPSAPAPSSAPAGGGQATSDGGSSTPWIVLAVVIGGLATTLVALVHRRRRTAPASARSFRRLRPPLRRRLAKRPAPKRLRPLAPHRRPKRPAAEGPSPAAPPRRSRANPLRPPRRSPARRRTAPRPSARSAGAARPGASSR
jgi:hypothetical protein